MNTEAADVPAAESVRPLELFFDLVFVFTITQVASVELGAGAVGMLSACHDPSLAQP